jgi:hypothetical protein
MANLLDWLLNIFLFTLIIILSLYLFNSLLPFYYSYKQIYTEEIPIQEEYYNTTEISRMDKTDYQEEMNNTLFTSQETDKLRWKDMPVTYHIVNEKKCGRYETYMIKRAFNEIENATAGVVYFEKLNNSEDADIIIKCSFIENCYKKEIDIGPVVIRETETICAHNSGYARIKYQGNRILKADIELIGLAGFAETSGKGPSGFSIGDCGYPVTEIHEILHAFGYQHNNNTSSIMYPEHESVGYRLYKEGECFNSIKSIDEWIIQDLISTYQQG